MTGVRDGYRFLKSMNTFLTRKESEKAGLPCGPYRTIASWYLWRVASLPDYFQNDEGKIATRSLNKHPLAARDPSPAPLLSTLLHPFAEGEHFHREVCSGLEYRPCPAAAAP